MNRIQQKDVFTDPFRCKSYRLPQTIPPDGCPAQPKRLLRCRSTFHSVFFERFGRYAERHQFDIELGPEFIPFPATLRAEYFLIPGIWFQRNPFRISHQ